MFQTNQNTTKTFVLPKTPPEVAMSLPEGTNLIDSMKIIKEEINCIVLATKQRSQALEWFKYKVGRITTFFC